jgi:uncharacterized protein YndB with AHSA1/START domain
MLPILLALAFIALILFLAFIGQSDEFTVLRRTIIAAPPERVFPHVNELRNWETWNPWQKMDPQCQLAYSGPPAGIGASYDWAGKKVGAGRSTITDSRPGQLVRLRLEFTKPMVATNAVEFSFQPEGSQTIVTWSMTGTRNACSKAFGLLMNFDAMCGRQFENGLASMKSVVETRG